MSAAIEQIVIVGAGLAGVSAAEELRTCGYSGKLFLIGAESHPPYDRPPLSKGLLLGDATAESTQLHPPQWYGEHDIQVIGDERVDAMDLAARQVSVGGRSLGYDRLLLATGARPRRLPLADASGADVVHLRTLDDAIALRAKLSGRLLIIGGGWIGLEVAAAARACDGEVTLVEAAPAPLTAVLGPEIAEVFAELHRSHGVDLRTGTQVLALDHTNGRTLAHLSDGTDLEVDTVVVAIGAEPETALAEAAGLTCSAGVEVDALLRTSDPFVHAAGDIASHDHPVLGRVRVEHWDNAIEQGRHAARTMLGATTAYTRQPYFFSDQYDLGMEYVGHVGPSGYDTVEIGGDLAKRVFTAYWVRGGHVVAGMHAGDWDAIDRIRALVGGPASALSD